MSLQAEYSKSIRKQLNHHVVWEPGFPVEIGDYGVMNNNAFKKLGNIKEFGQKFEFEDSLPAFWEFSSSGTKILKTDGQTDLQHQFLAHGTPDAKAGIKISFDDAYSFFIIAAESMWRTASNVDEVAKNLQQADNWDHAHFIITNVFLCNNLILLMSTTDASTIQISADAKLLTSFQKAKIKSSSKLSITGDAALKVIGVKGAFLVDTIRIRRFFGGYKFASSLDFSVLSYDRTNPQDFNDH